MVGLFRSRKPRPPADDAEPVDAPRTDRLSYRLNVKEVELYPTAIRLLWYYYNPDDQAKGVGSEKEYPGPIDETTGDSIRELEKSNLLEVIPTFSDFSVTARVTAIGLKLMAAQSDPATFAPTEVVDPGSGATMLYRAVNLG